jgi:hypothetical protein
MSLAMLGRLAWNSSGEFDPDKRFTRFRITLYEHQPGRGTA